MVLRKTINSGIKSLGQHPQEDKTLGDRNEVLGEFIGDMK
jgi:hypothetical protein